MNKPNARVATLVRDASVKLVRYIEVIGNPTLDGFPSSVAADSFFRTVNRLREHGEDGRKEAERLSSAMRWIFSHEPLPTHGPL